MSGAEQQSLDGSRSHPLHLTKRASRIKHTNCQQKDLTSREYWCLDCRLRVTRSRDLSKEYGHKRGCEHKIPRDGGDEE